MITHKTYKGKLNGEQVILTSPRQDLELEEVITFCEPDEDKNLFIRMSDKEIVFIEKKKGL